jgi:alcohol dehydrogenase class IV
MDFEFATANRIIFGRECFSQIGVLSGNLGRKAFLVTGAQALKASGKFEILKDALSLNGVQFSHFVVSSEPEIETVGLALTKARGENCDQVIGVGGGSVIDLAKAVAGLLTNESKLADYLEVSGKDKVLNKPAAPLIAVPTTAGSGAEATANAVIKDRVNQRKVSFRSPFLLPRVALIDPELTCSLSPGITAQSGMDALVHLIEAYTSKKAQPLTDLYCRDGISRIGCSLVKAYDNGNDQNARENMSLASLEGGIALANAGLGAVHGFAAALSGVYPIPHGLACARLLPHVVKANIGRLRSEGSNNPTLRRYQNVFEWLTGKYLTRESETIESGQIFLQELNNHLEIPPLSRFGINIGNLAEIAGKSAHASSMKANPVVFSHAELVEILEQALA